MSGAWLQPDWRAPTVVRAAVSTRFVDGVSQAPFDRCNLGLRAGEDVERVRENRRRIVEQLALPAAPSWLQQVHGTDVVGIGADDLAGEVVADAAVTRVPGRVLSILTADCLPVLFCAVDGTRIGAAHAGWRGLAAGVLENTVAAMAVAPGDLMAWIGPAIGAASYEVGEEVREAFLARDGGHAVCFSATRPNHWRCDLAGLARRVLRAAGVGRVDGGGFDTFTDARFYSYRRDGARSGRFASLIWFDER